ncbi:MAG TPA: hypothetical protein DDW26_08435 [Rhizobiales bacterium]|nr:hypothetical protein [Hyphomicrobiales bacterium]
MSKGLPVPLGGAFFAAVAGEAFFDAASAGAGHDKSATSRSVATGTSVPIKVENKRGPMSLSLWLMC